MGAVETPEPPAIVYLLLMCPYRKQSVVTFTVDCRNKDYNKVHLLEVSAVVFLVFEFI